MAKLHTLIDDFQDGVIDAAKWSTSGTVVETGGRARLTPTTSFSFLSTINPRTWDLTSSQIVAYIPTITSNGSTGTLQSGMAVDKDASNLVGIRKLGSQLICTKTVAGVETQLAFTPYSAVNHLFWRIRADSSNIYFETSPTGTGFLIQYTESLASLGFSVAIVGAFFFTGYSGVEVFPGTFQIESVNPGLSIVASGASTSSGSLTLSVMGPVQIIFIGASTSSGSLSMMTVSALDLTASGVSSSSGSLTLSVPTLLITSSASSTSSGALTFALPGYFISSGTSTSTGSLTFSIALSSAFFYFSPPVVYDNPPTLPEPTRPRWINAHAKWKGGQARGRSILKYTGALVYPSDTLFPDDTDLFPSDIDAASYVVVDTPTVDQMAAAEFTYLGGHIYTVTSTEAENLINAGFTIGAPA